MQSLEGASRKLARAAAVVLVTSCASRAAPVLSPEQTVDVRPGVEVLQSYAYDTEVAFAEGAFLLTWTDLRAGVWTTWAARLDLDGGITWNGRRALATTDDFRDHGPVALCVQGDSWVWLEAERYTGFTSLLRTTPTLQRLSRVRLDGSSDLAVHLDCRGSAMLWQHAPPRYNPDDSALQVRRLEPDAAVRELDGGDPVVDRLRVPAEEVSFDLASDGTTRLMVWAEGAGDAGLDVMMAHVDDVLGVERPVRLAGGAGEQADPHVAFGAGVFAVVWTDRAQGARDLRSNLAATPLLTTPDDEATPRVVFDGSTFVLAWTVKVGPLESEVRVATLSPTGALGPVQVVRRAYVDALRLATSGAGRSLVAWRDFDLGIHEVAVLLSGATPSRLGAAPIDPATTGLAQVGVQVFPLDATRRAVVWQQSRQVFARLEGVDAGAFALSGVSVNEPRFASNGAQVLAVTNDPGATLLSAATLAPLSSRFAFAPSRTQHVSSPRWDGQTFRFVTVELDGEVIARDVSPSGVVGAPVSVARPTDPSSQADFAINEAGASVTAWADHYRVNLRCQDDAGVRTVGPLVATYEPRPVLASDGTSFLAIFLDDTPGYQQRVRALRVQGDCSVGPLLELGVTEPWQPMAHAATWDGTQYVVTWVAAANDPNGDVVLSLVQLDGGVSRPLAVADAPHQPEGEPTVAAAGPGRWLVGYTRFDPDEAVSARRGLFRWVEDPVLDAGTEVDGGHPDAGPAVDAGHDAAPPAHAYRVGCGCTQADPALGIVGLALIAARGRCRRRSAKVGAPLVGPCG